MNGLRLLADGTVALAVYVQPKASKNRVIGVHGEELKISLTAPPVEGKANMELLHFLSRLLGVKKSGLSIISGPQSRHKQCRIEGIDIQQVEQRLGASLSQPTSKK